MSANAASLSERWTQRDCSAVCSAAVKALPGCLVASLASNECAVVRAGAPHDGTAAHAFALAGGAITGFETSAPRAPAVDSVSEGVQPSDSTVAAAAQPVASGPGSGGDGGTQPGETGLEHVSDDASREAQSYAPQLSPRVFVLSAAGRCVEFLRPGVYERYTAHYSGRQGVTELVSELPGGSLKLHRLVHMLPAAPATPAPLPVAEGLSSEPPETIKAIGSLRVPRRLYPAPTAGLVLPRIAAARPAADDARALPPVLLMREFVVHAPPSQAHMAAYAKLADAAEAAGKEPHEAASKVRKDVLAPLPLNV